MSDASPGSFRGRVFVVTGASSGLGYEIAQALAAEGAHLVLAGRAREPLAAAAVACRERGASAVAVPTDVTLDADCSALIECARAEFGGVDGLVAAAGLGMWARFGELSGPEVMEPLMAVNYWGVVQPAFHALPDLRARNGMLVVISSVQGRIGVPWHSGYAAAKHAVQGFCDSLRLEEGERLAVLTVLAHWIRGTELRARALGSDGRPRGSAAAGHGGDAMLAEEAAARVVAAMRQRRRELWIPRHFRLVGILSSLVPALTDRLIRRRVEREHARQPRDD